MYEWLSQISSWLSQPLLPFVDSNISIISALFLGILGSVAPCQLTANAAAVTYFGNRQALQKKISAEISLYLLGKAIVYLVLGFLFWWLGRQFNDFSIPVFAWSRKLQGPMLILIGLILLGYLRSISVGVNLSGRIKEFSKRKGGKLGALLLGMAFSIAFCPTMFALFFGSLMQLTLQSNAGFLFPPIFAVGTAIPFLLILIAASGLGINLASIKKSRRWGNFIQIICGYLFILLGIADTWTYWTLP